MPMRPSTYGSLRHPASRIRAPNRDIGSSPRNAPIQVKGRVTAARDRLTRTRRTVDDLAAYTGGVYFHQGDSHEHDDGNEHNDHAQHRRHVLQALRSSREQGPFGGAGVKVRSVAVGSAVIETGDGWTTGKAVAAARRGRVSGEGGGRCRERGVADARQGRRRVLRGWQRAQPGGGSAMPQGGSGAKPTGGCCG